MFQSISNIVKISTLREHLCSAVFIGSDLVKLTDKTFLVLIFTGASLEMSAHLSHCRKTFKGDCLVSVNKGVVANASTAL